MRVGREAEGHDRAVCSISIRRALTSRQNLGVVPKPALDGLVLGPVLGREELGDFFDALHGTASLTRSGGRESARRTG